MIKSVISVLLAATAFAPAIAQDQRPNPEVRGGAQVDAQRQGDQARRDAYRAQRQQQRGQQVQPGAQMRQGQPQPVQPAQVQAQAQQNQYRQQGQQGQYQRGQYQQGQYQQGQRPTNVQADQRGYDPRDNRQGRPNFGPNAPGGQGGYAGRGNDARGNDGRGYDNRGYQQQGRGYQDQRAGNNRGGWNTGWRGDSRYDWNRYRTENRSAFHLPRYYAPGGGYGYRRYSVGITLGYGFYGQNYWIGNPYDYRLPPAYGPYRWVRYYNDALLVDIRTGYVVDTAYGIFW